LQGVARIDGQNVPAGFVAKQEVNHAADSERTGQAEHRSEVRDELDTSVHFRCLAQNLADRGLGKGTKPRPESFRSRPARGIL
jgi:hypothetical protein